MKIRIPEHALVLLIGASGAGKSTFCEQHFLPTEVVSSDAARAAICDDENNQDVTSHAFEVLHLIVHKRLRLGRFTVVDATNTQPKAREPLLVLAKRTHTPVYVILFDLPLDVNITRQLANPKRKIPPKEIKRQWRELEQVKRQLPNERIEKVYTLDSEEAVAAVSIDRYDPWAPARQDQGPFDLVGDIHGCYDELLLLLDELGYHLIEDENGLRAAHPSRKLVFLGDLVDRGPRVPDTIRLVMNTVASGGGYCVPGNHDMKLARKLNGNEVTIRHGLAESLEQLAQEPEQLAEDFKQFMWNSRSHLILDEGRLIAVHAGIKGHYIGRESKSIWSFSLYGDVTSKEVDAYGLPVRGNWAADYEGEPWIIYGHVPVSEPYFKNQTVCIDTGCVFGGSLTAWRYPEEELVSVPAAMVYYEPTKPLAPYPD